MEEFRPPKVGVDTYLDRLNYLEQRIAAKNQKWEVEAYRRSIETLQGEALKRLIEALRDNPDAATILEEAAAEDDVIYTVLRQHDIIKPTIEARVERALAKIRPQLANHNGDLEVVAVAPPRLSIRLLGACEGCPAQVFTVKSIIASALKLDCPEIREFVEVKADGDAPSPVRLESEGWRPAGLVNEIDGGARDLVIDREQVLLVQRGETTTCFAAYCPHRGVGIDSRDIEGDGLLLCPRHGYQFDLNTGECLTYAGLDLERYELKTVDDKLMVKLPGR